MQYAHHLWDRDKTTQSLRHWHSWKKTSPLELIVLWKNITDDDVNANNDTSVMT